MKLIVESGATKTDFCLLCGKEQMRFRLDGINLATMSDESIANVLSKAKGMISEAAVADNVKELYFYGAGIVSEANSVKSGISESSNKLDYVLRKIFVNASVIEYNSDLTASARALWGRTPGISVILGTGSNSCLYDGRIIVSNVRPCGFIIGDFGSGAALGKVFLADYLQNQMPVEIFSRFEKDYCIDYKSIVRSVYKDAAPARFLASFAPYILSLTEDRGLKEESMEYLEKTITDNFRTFIRRCLLQYNPSLYHVGVTGSFGCAARKYLEKAGDEYGVRFSVFQPSPMDGLIKYHSDYV